MAQNKSAITGIIQPSFTAGELAPSLYGRVDFDLYYKALRTCRNFIVSKYGGVDNRPGTQFISAVDDSTKIHRAIPFQFNNQQQYVLVLGDKTMQVVANGALITNDTAYPVTGVNAAFVVQLTVVGHPFTDGETVNVIGVDPSVNGSWGISVIDANNIALKLCRVTSLSWSGGGTVQAAGTIPVSVPTPWVSEDLAMLKFTQSADVITVTHSNYPTQQIERLSQTNWRVIPFANVNGPFLDINIDETITVTASAVTGSITVTASKDLFTADMIGLEFYMQQSPDDTTAVWEVSKTIAAAGIVMFGSNYYQSTAGGNTGTVGPTVTEGTQRDGSPGVLWNYLHSGFGIVKISGYTDAQHVTADVISRLPDLLVSVASYLWALPAWSPAQGYPGTTSYFQLRQIFGATFGEPSRLDFSRTKGFYDFGQDNPILDDDAITYNLLSNKVNTIRHMLELTYLIIFTSGGIYKVSGGKTSNNNVITPSTIDINSQGSNAVSDVAPLHIGNYALFLQEKGNQVRTLGYSFAEDSFIGQDVTTMSNHLLEFNPILEWAYQEIPHACIWSVRDDGELLGFTFNPEQQITAWHHHDTQGTFESVCSITENNKDVAYFIVNRTLNGKTVRCIERMAQRKFQDPVDAYFVDCGLTYDGRASNTTAAVFSGLDHLEGETVAILADGIVYPQQVVTGGQVTIPNAALVCHVGLPYVSDFETLNIASLRSNITDKKKSINSVSLIVDKSAGFEVGPDVDNLLPYKTRSAENYGAPDNLLSELIDIDVPCSWEKPGRVFVRQSKPLPLTILAAIPQVAIGGH